MGMGTGGFAMMYLGCFLSIALVVGIAAGLVVYGRRQERLAREAKVRAGSSVALAESSSSSKGEAESDG